MNDFSRFKKKIIREHIIKSLIYGLSISITFTAVFVVIAKRVPLNIHFALFILFAFLLAAGFSYLFYKALMPTDLKIAKRLDKKFGLNEKVQTMIQYKDQNGVLVEVQRENTLGKLNAIPSKKLPMKFTLVNYIIAAFAFGLFTTSLFVPNKVIADDNPVVEPNPSDDNSTPNDGDENNNNNQNQDDTNSGLDDARDAIEGSDVDQDIKDKMDKVVDDLEKDLENAETDEEKDKLIDDAKKDIDGIVDEANSKEEIGDSLEKSEDDILKELGEAIKNGDNQGVEDALERLKDELNGLTGDELTDALDKVSQEIKDALEDSGIEEGDKLRDALEDLADSLKGTSDQLKDREINEDTAQDQIGDAIDQAIKDIQDALDEQKKVEDLGEQVKDAMDKEKSDGEGEEGDDKSDEDGEESDKEDNQNNENNDSETPEDGEFQPGSKGDGETNFGSNDTIFNGEGYSEYGDVIDDYYDDIVDQTKDNDIPSDIDDILRDYFESLYNGDKK